MDILVYNTKQTRRNVSAQNRAFIKLHNSVRINLYYKTFRIV